MRNAFHAVIEDRDGQPALKTSISDICEDITTQSQAFTAQSVGMVVSWQPKPIEHGSERVSSVTVRVLFSRLHELDAVSFPAESFADDDWLSMEPGSRDCALGRSAAPDQANGSISEA